MAKVLVAGATGALGRDVVEELLRRDHHVRVITRSPAKAASLAARGVEVREADPSRGVGLEAALQGVEMVFSSLGASVVPSLGEGWRGFGGVDVPINRRLIDAAQRAKASRFVYVSVARSEAIQRTRYVVAHERVVASLEASGLAHAVVRPTGFFSAFASMVPMARRGPLPELGDGKARTNPIHTADLAQRCVDAIEARWDGGDIGGPEVLTRREIASLVFSAIGRPLELRAMPPALGAFMGNALWPFLPRMADLMQFFTRASTHDIVAPGFGTRTLAEFLREEAKRLLP